MTAPKRSPAEKSQSADQDPPWVLVVDDDSSITASIALTLKQSGYRCQQASSPRQALAALSDSNSPPVDLILQDMNFSRATSGDEGLRLLTELRGRSSVPVILMTAWGSIDLAVAGMRAGAADFLTKPWTRERLLESVATALDVARARAGFEDASPVRAELEARADFRGLLGQDAEFLHLLDLVARVAPTDASVLITGESGTGKEELAEAVHRNSRRSSGPFVKVNVGGLSPSLFESEMFGHVRGAFTDARSHRAGRFEVAHGGTIFLDEIGELDPTAQVKLLRVLQDRTYEPLGSSETRTVDVRVVAATNRNLNEMVHRGSFREDLLYRLNLIALELPPLRRRRGDVPILAHHFLARGADVYGRSDVHLTDDALDWLVARPWPGNIRQLKQVIERAVLLARHDRLDAATLRQLEDPTAARAADTPDLLPPPASMTLEEMERGMIVKSLAYYGGNLTRTALALGLSRAALYRRLEKYDLQPDGSAAAPGTSPFPSDTPEGDHRSSVAPLDRESDSTPGRDA